MPRDDMPRDDGIRIDVQRQAEGGAEALNVRIGINPESLRLRETQMGVRILLDGWRQGGRIGRPGHPTRTFWIALPDGMEAAGPLRAEVLREHPIASRTSRLAPARTPLTDTPHLQRQAARKLRRAARAGAEDTPPLARLRGAERVGTTGMALLEVNPLIAAPGEALRLATEISVTLPLARAAARKPARLEAITPVQGERLTELARTIAVNPRDVPPLAPTLRELKERYDYVIVTDDMAWDARTKAPRPDPRPGMTAAFQALANWKTERGLSARVVTVAQIIGSRADSGFGRDFASGARDLQEAIRNFLRWAQTAWGTAYVLLGGDEAIVPIRRLAIGDWNRQLPTDHYYSALDPRNDGWTEGAVFDYGALGFDRLLPHLSVGRAPAANTAEAHTFVAKVRAYEGLRSSGNALSQDWLRRMLHASWKWGGADPTVVTRSAAFPPPDHGFAPHPSRPVTLIKLIDRVQITQDPDRTSTSPGEGRFNRAPGTDYVKIHLAAGYKLPHALSVATADGRRLALQHTDKAGAAMPGWFYTDWTDHDRPCHDAAGVNYPTLWLIVYLPAGATPLSFEVEYEPELRIDYNLLAKSGPGDYRPIPFDPAPSATGSRWCFARSANDPTPSPVGADGEQVPTAWLLVEGDARDRAPLIYHLDPTEMADTMREQEELRAAIRDEVPAWDLATGLYPDVVDLPPGNRGSIDAQYYTRDRVVAKLNEGQHIVSLSGHGLPWATCWNGEGGAFTNAEADTLRNSPPSGLVYINSCLSNRYTEDNLGRHLVMRGPHGSVACVGYMDTVEIALGHFFEKKFFADLARTGILGLAFDARASMVAPGSGVSGARVPFTVMMMSLLGDPALRIHGARPEYLAASALATGRHATGALGLSWLRPDGRLAHVRQESPGSGWDRARIIDAGSWGRRLVQASNADGRLEVFYIGSDSKLYHIWQTAPNGGWSASYPLDPGSWARELAVAQNADGRLEVFYIGSDSRLYHIWQTAPNSGWTGSFPLDPGSWASSLAVERNADGRLEVFYIGSDNRLHHVWQTAPNSGWTTSSVLDPGSWAQELTAARNQDGRLEVFYIGSDRRLYHIWQTAPNGGWSGSSLLVGDGWAKAPAAERNADGRLEVFYVGADNRLCHIWQTAANGGWSAPDVLDPGSWARGPVATRNADGRLEVFYIGSNDRIHHLWQIKANDGWGGSRVLEG